MTTEASDAIGEGRADGGGAIPRASAICWSTGRDDDEEAWHVLTARAVSSKTGDGTMSKGSKAMVGARWWPGDGGGGEVGRGAKGKSCTEWQEAGAAMDGLRRGEMAWESKVQLRARWPNPRQRRQRTGSRSRQSRTKWSEAKHRKQALGLLRGFGGAVVMVCGCRWESTASR